MLKNVTIRLQGCDGETVTDVMLSERSIAFLKILARRINKDSEYSCEPRMVIESPDDAETPYE